MPIITVVVLVLLCASAASLYVAVCYVLPVYGIYRLAKYCRKEFWDMYSLLETGASLTLIIWFADNMAGISWNLVGCWILLQGIFLILRILKRKGFLS